MSLPNLKVLLQLSSDPTYAEEGEGIIYAKLARQYY